MKYISLIIGAMLACSAAPAAPAAWRYNAPRDHWKACEQAFTRHSITWPYCGRD